MNEQFKNLKFMLLQIERKIGYIFDNQDLLTQAFIRTTYKEENGGEDNQVLEFIGDKYLDASIIRLMMDKFSRITNYEYQDGYSLNQFTTKLDEGQFTNLKKNLVDKQALSEFMDKLGFNEYLIMGNGDIKSNIRYETSVKEDLFEAIIGAVAIDSNYDMDTVTRVVGKMIDLDKYLDYNATVSDANINYIGLFNEWYQNEFKESPKYKLEELEGRRFRASIEVKNVHSSVGDGDSKDKAKYNAAKDMYSFLDFNGYIKTELERTLDGLCLENALSKLNMLTQKKLVVSPVIKTSPDLYGTDEIGWGTTIYLNETKKDYYFAAKNKQESKTRAVYDALVDLLRHNNKSKR